MKIGAAYVPAEPDFPEERIRFMMRDGQVDYVITHEKYVHLLDGYSLIFIEKGIEIDRAVHAEVQAKPPSLAYILYTSGSTGAPKGIAVTNLNVCHYVRAFRDEFHPTLNDVMLQYSVCSFDIFVEEVFAALLSGAVLAIPSKKTRGNIHSLMNFIEDHHVTIVSGFPYLLQEMNDFEQFPESIRLMISGGDVLRANYINHLLNKVLIYNTYGPSETTVCATYFKCNGENPLPDGTFPIGRAVKGCAIEILDEEMNAVEPGQYGEICILGDGVSNGYIGNRERENMSFIQCITGERLYRSGDLGYMLPDGNLAFLRRKDTQVMIGGKRVEPYEVENVLCACPEVKQGFVSPYIDEQGLSYMVAYFVPEKDDSRLSLMKKQMAAYLPSYMIPEFFVKLTELPLTPNGKVDVQALPVVMKGGKS